jgi:hypothetical protein
VFCALLDFRSLSTTGLRFLDVSFNQISTIPPELARLTSLTRLNLSFNPLGDFFPIAITGMVALKELNLDFTGENLSSHFNISSLQRAFLIASFKACYLVKHPIHQSVKSRSIVSSLHGHDSVMIHHRALPGLGILPYNPTNR